MFTKYLLFSNLMVCGFLVGLIWFVQVVHYPIFAKVGKNEFASYHAQHVKDTGKVVALPMLLELGLAFMLLVMAQGQVPFWQNLVAFVLVLIIWAQTFFFFVPLHSKLGASADAQIISRLVNANGWRTLFWSLRFMLLGWMVFNY